MQVPHQTIMVSLPLLPPYLLYIPSYQLLSDPVFVDWMACDAELVTANGSPDCQHTCREGTVHTIAARGCPLTATCTVVPLDYRPLLLNQFQEGSTTHKDT